MAETDSSENRTRERAESVERAARGDATSSEDFEAQFEKQGTSPEEGSQRIEELMKAAQSDEVPDGPDRELIEAARDRLEQTGSKEDAIRALSLMAESGRATEAGKGPSPESIPFRELAEETGLSSDDLLVTATVDGEEVEIPLSEAVSGYQRQKDYTRKTQEVAETRQEAEQLRDAYAQRLEMLATTIGQNLTPQQQQALVSEYQRIKGQAASQQYENVSEVVEAEQEKLREAFEWSEDGEWDEARGRLREYAHDLGYSDEELEQVRDHRLLAVLEKARRWEEAQSKSEEVRKKAKGKDPAKMAAGTRPVAGSGSSKRKKEQRVDAARKRLKKTGSRRDGARAVKEILGRGS